MGIYLKMYPKNVGSKLWKRKTWNSGDDIQPQKVNSGQGSYTAHLEIVPTSKAGNRETERSTKEICKVVEGRSMRIMEREKEGGKEREGEWTMINVQEKKRRMVVRKSGQIFFMSKYQAKKNVK